MKPQERKRQFGNLIREVKRKKTVIKNKKEDKGSQERL